MYKDGGLINHLKYCYDNKIRFSHNLLDAPQVVCYDVTFEGGSVSQTHAAPENKSGIQSIQEIFEIIEVKRRKKLESVNEMIETEAERKELIAA